MNISSMVGKEFQKDDILAASNNSNEKLGK